MRRMPWSGIPVFIAVAMVAPALASAATWQIDPMHSQAQFQVRHMMVSTVRGQLGKVTGTVQYDGKDLKTASVDATIDVTGIDTGQPKRDEDLKSPNFFDVQKYPTITFKSTRIEIGPKKGQLKMTGDLTMHGVTKEVTLDVDGPSPPVKDMRPGMMRTGASATGRLRRKDFGLTWNRALEGGGAVVGDEVILTIDVELVSNATKAAR